MSLLRGKRIVLGVTGGIAAYKAAEIVRLLVRDGADVRVVMTRSAREFITPLTLQTLSAHPVATDLFDLGQESEIGHIRLADEADAILVAPATAHAIARFAHGFADDLLSTLLLATRAPVVVAPAMNVNMYRHPATQTNLTVLRERGVFVVPPGEGELACGWQGAGRLPASEDVVEGLRAALTPQDLVGETVLVAAGPTREPVDPVRYVSNRSSGKMGYAIARAACRRGADVVLVSGPTGLVPPAGAGYVAVTTAEEMRAAVLEHGPASSVIVMAAAVADYRPARPALQKIKKGEKRTILELESTTDILAELGKSRRPGRLVIGFAAETEDPVGRARDKLRRKGADWIVCNDVSRPDAGFDVDTNQVTVLDGDGAVEEWPLLSKDDVADRLMARVSRARSTTSKGRGSRRSRTLPRAR